MAELNQDFTGKWRITGLKHDHPGVTIPATFTYKGISKSLQITSSEQTVVFPDGWKTPLGVSINLNEISRNYEIVNQDGKRYETHDNFTVSNVDPVAGAVYTLTVSGPDTLAANAGGDYTATLVLKVNGELRASQDVTGDASWAIESGPGDISGHHVTNTNSSGSDKTIKVKATYNMDGVSATGTKDITARSSGGGVWNVYADQTGFTSDSGSTILHIGCDSTCEWTAYSEDSWITVERGTGTGSATQTIRIAKYTDTEEDRIGHVYVYGNSAGQSTSITILQEKAAGQSSLTIRYTGSQVSAASGSTSDFTITANNATVTGYTVNNGASIQSSGTSSVTVSYPANQNESQTKTYTVTVRGKDSNNNLVTGSTTFTQAKDNNYTFSLSPSDTTAESTQVSKAFTVTSTNVTNVGYASSLSTGLTGGTANATSATARFSQNQSTSVSNKTFVITGKTESERTVQASATIRQQGTTPPPEEKYLIFVDESDLNAYVNVPCSGISSNGVRIQTNLSSSNWGASSNKTWIHVTVRTADVLIEVDENTGGARNGVVTITGTSVASLTVPVSQIDCTPSAPVIEIPNIDEVLDDFLNVPCSGFPEPGYTFTVNVTPAYEWTITEDTGDMWTHVSKSGNQAKVVIDQNGLSQRDTTLIINLVDQSLGATPISIQVVQEACTNDSYIHIEDEETHSASAMTHILDQSKTFTFDLDTNGIVGGTLGTASTVNHASEHGEIASAWVTTNDFRVNLDGRTLEHIGTGYVTNYIDVTGTSVYGGTVRATLILRIELEKANMKFIFETNGAPEVLASYELRVDGNTIINGSGQQTITYVAYSEHDLSVKANVTQTTSYDPQTIDVNIVGDNGIIEPNYGSVQLILPGNFGPAESSDYTTRFMGDGTVVVSFTWSQTYVYRLTTTQEGCTVVMCGNTVTTYSTANYEYTMASVESTMSYTVTKEGYYPQTGTIQGPNRNITVTLVEIVDTYEDVRTDPASVRIINRTNGDVDIESFYLVLYGGTGQILGIWQTNTMVTINGNGSQDVQLQSYNLGTKQVLTNTSPYFELHIKQYNGPAMWATFEYPNWRASSFSTIQMQFSAEGYDGEAELPPLERAQGSTYVFPHSNFTLTLTN